MKRGMIIYVAEGNEATPLKGPEELVEISRSLGVATVCLATSEEELADGWWHLLKRGVAQVLFLSVAFDPREGKFSKGETLWLCGSRCGFEFEAGQGVDGSQCDEGEDAREIAVDVRH